MNGQYARGAARHSAHRRSAGPSGAAAGPGALVLLLALSATPVLSQESDCNGDIAAASTRLRAVYQARLSRCMKEGNYGDCTSESVSILEGAQDLRNAVAHPDGACASAVTGGVPLTNLGPDVCPPSGAKCHEEVGAIVDLDGLADCLICMQKGFDSSLRLQLDLPAGFPSVLNERKCIRSVTTRSLKAIRAGVREVERCASGGVSPFNCPAGNDPESKFARTLSRVAVAVARCKDAAGIAGQLSGDSARLCHHTAQTPSELVQCAEAAARCLVCSHANGVLRQSQDCMAYSGIACRQTRSTTGNIYVANADDDSVTYFSGARTPLYGTLAASTFPAGDAPSAVVVNPVLNVVYVANSVDGTVTFLDAATGEPLYGSLSSSTFAVGADPGALAIDTDSDLLYVANRGSDSVTLLNALNGDPYFGGLPASTLAVGDEPRALVHSSTKGIVYVANFGSDSVTLLDADTGSYLNGTLVDSTAPAGDGPIAISDPDHDAAIPNVVLVANFNESTVTYLDADTLAPRLGTLAESSLQVGAGPRAIATGGQYFGHDLLYVASDDGTVTLLKTTPNVFGQYVQATRANATFPIASTPSAMVTDPSTGNVLLAHSSLDEITEMGMLEDAAISTFGIDDNGCIRISLAVDEADNRLYLSCNTAVGAFDATTGAFAFGNYANSVFPFPGLVRSMALDPVNDVLYVGGYDVAGGSDGVAIVSALTGLPVAPFAAETTAAAWDVAFSPSLEQLYTAHYISTPTPFFVLDAVTGSTIASLDNGVREPLLINETDGILYGRAGNAIRFLDSADGTPLFGTPENSTFAAGNDIGDLAIDEGAGLLYVPNPIARNVRVFDSATGAYALGSEAASTFDTHINAHYIAVEPSSSKLFVHSASHLAMLESLTGLPVNGDIKLSLLDTLDVGPVAVNTTADRLYVGAEGWSGVSFYRLSTGAFLNSELPAETFATGNGPSAIALME